MGLTFFGLTSKNIKQARVDLFRQLHQITFFGKGGYSYMDVYNMPIWLRMFTFNEIRTYLEEKDTVESNQGETKIDPLNPDRKVIKAGPQDFKKIS